MNQPSPATAIIRLTCRYTAAFRRSDRQLMPPRLSCNILKLITVPATYQHTDVVSTDEALISSFEPIDPTACVK